MITIRQINQYNVEKTKKTELVTYKCSNKLSKANLQGLLIKANKALLTYVQMRCANGCS